MDANNSQIIIYNSADGSLKLDVRFEGETVWLSQKMMAELFQTSVPNINLHLKNIFDEGELESNRTIKDFLIVQLEGNREVSRKIDFYNLDAIISVGYRIKSKVATKFRQWATKHIKEYILKGFILDDDRLKNPKYAPCPLLVNMVRAGKLGVKSGEGFYDYSESKKAEKVAWQFLSHNQF